MQQPIHRAAAVAARNTRTSVPRTQRRFASDSHGSGHHDHGHASHEPVKESFGMGFYIPLSLIPISYLLYQASRPGADGQAPWITRKYAEWSDVGDLWAKRTDQYIKMLDQAALDRNLFFHSKGSDTIELRFPEIFNVGSPYNVTAGSQVDLSAVIEKYRREANEANELKHQQLREGTLLAEQPATRTPGLVAIPSPKEKR